MSLQICSLNSGSNGNCYYVGNDHDAVLIDAGLSCRETEKRMKFAGLEMQRVRAIFISHEHGDHVKGLTGLANKYRLPVYITPATLNQSLYMVRHLAVNFAEGISITIGTLEVQAFSKKHDANDPHSFLVSSRGVNVGVITDVGCACNNVVHYFKQCHAVFLESNYDEKMLQNGPYPIHLKNRISTGHGHLSNRQALELFLHHRAPFLSHLILSHLSKENNCPQLVEELFLQYNTGVKISVASRYNASEIFHIQSPSANQIKLPKSKPIQITLFN